MADLITILCIWGIVGALVIAPNIVPARTCIGAWLQILIIGPLAWSWPIFIKIHDLVRRVRG